VSARCWESQQGQQKVQLEGPISVMSAEPEETIELAPRQLPTPYDEMLTSFEGMHIRSLRNREFLFGFTNLQYSRKDGRRLWELVLRRFGSNLSSKPLRYACILYSLFKNGLMAFDGTQVLLYLDQFYKSTREAVEHENYPDLVYGCFAGCMYVLRVRPRLQEITHHAKAFQISVHRMAVISVVTEEELFLLECMWEKMMWYAAKHLLFEPSTKAESLNLLAELAQPLFPSADKAQPSWIQESYSELKLKRQLVQFIVYLEQCSVVDAGKIKWSLYRRFRRDQELFGTQIKTLSSASCCHQHLIHTLSRKLWSELFNFLFDEFVGTPFQPLNINQSTISRIFSIHSIVELIPKLEDECLEEDTRNALDLAIYCLSLIGLTISESQHDWTLGRFLRQGMLSVLVFDLTRAHLVRCLNCSGGWEIAFLSSFDRVCLQLSLGAQSAIMLEKLQLVLSLWIEICN
jgi:hypothetical protein